MKNLKVKGKWFFAAVLALLTVSVLAGTVYAVTLDMANITPLAADIGSESLGAVPEEAENAGYTHSLKINGFTDNGLGGTNYFYLSGADGEALSFYYDNGASSGVYNSSKRDFVITSNNSFYIDPSCNTVRITEPNHGRWRSMYGSVTVTAGGVDVTGDLQIDYHSNLEDNVQSQPYVEITGLARMTGDLEISGLWYHLDTNAYFNTVGRDGAVRITVTGQNDYSVVNESHSRTWSVTAGGQEWLVYNGSYSLTAAGMNNDTHELEKLELIDTDLNNQERVSTFYPDSEGVIYFNTPTPDVKKGTRQYIKGNVKADYPDVTDRFEITQLTPPDPETGETTFNITFPDELDFGNVIIMVYFEQKPSAFAHFEYQPDSTRGAFNPDAVIKGQIKDNITGSIAVNGNTDVEMAIYEEEAPIYTTVELGGSGNNSFFREANLVYTLKDYATDNELVKFRIYRGQILPVGDYTGEDLSEYLYTAGSLVEKYGTDHGGLKERAVIRFKLPESGLSLVYSAEPTYIPVTVRQHKLNNNGQQSNADNAFMADVYKNTTGEDGRYADKYFAADAALTSSYGMGSADDDAFTDSYTVTGASGTRYMYYDNTTGGLYLYPNPASGYTVAAIRARARNFSNGYVTDEFNQKLTQVPVSYDSDKGYAIVYQTAARRYLQSESLEIEVYYQPKTSLTIKQHIDGELEAGTLAEVTLTNTNPSAPVSPYSAFADQDSKEFLDSLALVDTKNNVVEYDESVPGALSRTTRLTVNRGVKPELVIRPHGARNISTVKITKKNGSRYVADDESEYTVSGSLAVNGSVTYTFNNSVNIGDDYVVDIVYGTEKTLTVKAVIIDREGNADDVDTEEEFNESKATVTVSAERYDADGSAVAGEYAFTDKTVEPYAEINGFTVTYNPTTVTAVTNTRVTVNTQIAADSQYVIANVKAVKDSGDDLHLAVPSTVVYGGSEVGQTYENCTLSSLASTDNVTIVVYLAKVVNFNVSVYTISAAGEVNNGVPAGSDAYVNVNVETGEVTVNGAHSETGVIPFTKLVPPRGLIPEHIQLQCREQGRRLYHRGKVCARHSDHL